MKITTKKLLFGVAGGLLLCGGSIFTFLQAAGHDVLSESKLTLANIEAMAFDDDLELEGPDNPGMGCDAYNSCNGVDITCHGESTCESGQNGNVKYVMCDGFNFVTCRI